MIFINPVKNPHSSDKINTIIQDLVGISRTSLVRYFISLTIFNKNSFFLIL